MLYIKITLDVVHIPTELDKADFKYEQSKNILRLSHLCKIRALELRSVFLVLIKKRAGRIENCLTKSIFQIG